MILINYPVIVWYGPTVQCPVRPYGTDRQLLCVEKYQIIGEQSGRDNSQEKKRRNFYIFPGQFGGRRLSADIIVSNKNRKKKTMNVYTIHFFY